MVCAEGELTPEEVERLRKAAVAKAAQDRSAEPKTLDPKP